MPEVQQKIISCPKGHYYDANKYASCPHCGGGSFAPTVDPFAPTPGAVSGSFGPTVDPFAGNTTSGGFGPTIDPFSGAVDGTVPAGYTGPVERMNKTEFVDDSTPAGAPAPVVGWLVAIEGPCRGTDYRIHSGYNTIGRESGDIRIHGDNTISAANDSVVTYVIQTAKFYIAHQEGKNVLLVNDLPVIGGVVELKNYDIITIGTTKLIFVGLCGESFSWNKKENG